MFRNVGCCDGMPAGEMGGIDVLPDWVPVHGKPCEAGPIEAPFEGPDVPCLVWFTLFVICDDEPTCVLMAGWDGVVETDDVRW